MGAENTADFKISGKISLALIVIAISFILSIGGMFANNLNLEKRIVALEQREEKTCTMINDLLVVNARIGENLTYIKDTLKEHVKGDK
jgi:hypothetical protein